MFNIGELRDVLEVYEELLVPNDLGIDCCELKRLYKLRCKRNIVSSKDYIIANRDFDTITVKFLVFSRRDIYLNNIVIYKNEEYDIKHINPYGNGWIELTCEVRK